MRSEEEIYDEIARLEFVYNCAKRDYEIVKASEYDIIRKTQLLSEYLNRMCITGSKISALHFALGKPYNFLHKFAMDIDEEEIYNEITSKEGDE